MWCELAFAGKVLNVSDRAKTSRANTCNAFNAIFRPASCHPGDLTAAPCSSATMIPRYRMVVAPIKKVDYAIAYQPHSASSCYDHLKVVIQGTPAPNPSLNHTSCTGLCDHAMVLSVQMIAQALVAYIVKLATEHDR